MFKDQLKFVYATILQGHSSFLYRKKLVYAKHLNQLENALIDTKRNEYIEYFRSNGAPTSQERLDSIIQDGLWSKEKDHEIDEIKDFIVSLEHSKAQAIIKKEKELLNKEINKHKERLFKLVIEKSNLIGKTANTRAEKKLNEYYILVSLYSDISLTTQLFQEEEFDLLEEIELHTISKLYNEAVSIFNNENLKQIALMPYFFNLYMLAGDNIINLFGKPLISLTAYQIELIQNARNYRNILQNSKIPPPPEYLQNPSKLLEWFERSETANKIAQDMQVEEPSDKKVLEAAKSIVGASKEEIKELGFDTSRQDKIEAELKKRKEQGLAGEIDMMTLLKMQS